MKRLVLAIAMLTTVPARADETRFDTAGLTTAINALNVKLGSGDFLSDQDPLVSDAVSRMTAATTAIDGPLLPVTGRGTLTGICFPVGDIAHAYVTAALKAKIAATPAGKERTKVEAAGIDGAAASHIATYFPMVLLSTKCHLAHLTMIAKMLAAVPMDQRTANQIASGRMMRDSMYHMVRSSIGMTISLVVGARRQAMLAVLTRYSQEIARSVTADQKADLIATINIAKAGWPEELRASGQKLIAALRGTECSALCAQ